MAVMTGSDYMKRALELAALGRGDVNPNPMVGAVIVRDGKVIGEGWHHRPGGAHAEVEALRDAERRGEDVTGAEIYVTLEPCSTFGRTPPCTEALIRAKLSRAVIGCTDPNPEHAGRGMEILRSHGIETEIDSANEPAARKLNESFFKWITVRRPFTLLKMAVTLDGRIATASGDSKWITGAEARERVQFLRWGCDAILVGGETFRRDVPRLDVRDSEGRIIRSPRKLVACRSLPEGEISYEHGTAEVCHIGEWGEFLDRLGKENCTLLLIEGGGELAASALRAKAVDKVEFHIAPKILGGAHSRPAVGGEDPLKLVQALELQDVEYIQAGRDMIVSGYLPER